MTRAVVAACLLTVVICLPSASEGKQYWGGNPWRQYWQPSRNPNCERAYPAKETNGYVHACRYVCVGLPIRYNFEEDGTPCYADRWQQGTCYAGRCQRAWWAPAPTTARRVATTTAPATTSEAKPTGSNGGIRPTQNAEGQGCPRAYPVADVRRTCRYLCQGWPFRHENEVDGTPCQLSSWRQGVCYLGHCQKNLPVPKLPQDEDNNVEGKQGSSARLLKCRNYRGRETVDGAVRSCTFVCKKRKNSFLALEDNGTPCWGWQGQRGYCDQGVCKAVEVQASTTAAEPVQTEASATGSFATQSGSSTTTSGADTTTAEVTTTAATGAVVTDPATVSATKAVVTAAPATRSPWVPGFVGVKCDRAFPAKTIDGQVTSCRYLCEGYPRLRIGFEADGTPCLKKKTTAGLCSSGFCKPLPPPTEKPAAEDESATGTATTVGNFATDDFFLTTVPSTTGDNEEAESAATLPAESSTSHEAEFSDSTPTSVSEDSPTTAAESRSAVTGAAAAGETDLLTSTAVDAALSTTSPSLPGTTEPKKQLPEEENASNDGLEASTAEGFTDRDAVGGATAAPIVETTNQEAEATASTNEAREEHTGTDARSVATDLPVLSTSTAKGDDEASRDELGEGATAASASEHLADVSTDAATVEEGSGAEPVTQANDDLAVTGEEKDTATTSGGKEVETEGVQTRTTALGIATEESTEEAIALTTQQPEEASGTSSTRAGSAHEELATVSTQALPDDSGLVTVEASTSQDDNSHVTWPVSVDPSSEPVVNTEQPNKSHSPISTGTPTVDGNDAGGATAAVVTEDAAVSAGAGQATDAFQGHTEERVVTSSSQDVSVEIAAEVTVVTSAETIATDEDEKQNEEQTTQQPVSEPMGTQESTEASAVPSDVSVSKVVDPEFLSTETPNQEQDTETGESTGTVLSEEEHVSEVPVTAHTVVDVTKENEPLINADTITTASPLEATVAAVEATAGAAASDVAVPGSTTQADIDNDSGADATTVATAGATVVVVEETSRELVSEVVTGAPEEVASTSLPDAHEEQAKEEVTTHLPAAAITEVNKESTTLPDESATVKVITTITRKEIVRPVDPNVEQANLTSVDTTRTISVETLPASEVSTDIDASRPAETDAAFSESTSNESPSEVTTVAVPAVVSDATESSQSEDESATVKVITTITRTEIVRPIEPDTAQDNVISVQKTSSSSVETVPVSASNSPTTVDSVAEVDATSADESAPATTEASGAVSSGPHIIITDFVQKTAVSSKEPVTVPTAEDKTAYSS